MNRDEPGPNPLGVSNEGAVRLCRQWMVHLGATDTVVASGPTRAVCDLFSSRYVAWVDNGREALGATAVLRAAEVASSDGRQAMIFKRGGIGGDAQRQADRRGVALFSYLPSDGILEGANPLGYQLRAAGLSA